MILTHLILFSFFPGASTTATIPSTTPVSRPIAGGSARFFTPYEALPGRKKRRRIDELVAKEAQIKAQIVEYQETGVDEAVLNDLYAAIKELQLIILQLALESQAAANYIEMKRDEEEDEDIRYILQFL